MRGTLWSALVLAACNPYEGTAPRRVVDEISATAMKETVDYLADDAGEGRILGSAGHDDARDYVLAAYDSLGVQRLGVDGGFVHTYPHVARAGDYKPAAAGGAEPTVDGTGENLVAVLPGADPARADEYIVLMAHYDHLGVTADGTETFNGAFDDAGGVAMVLEIARAMVASGEIPGRSVMLLITDGEEVGLQGAENWIDTPTIDPSDILAAISIDPVGRPYLPDYWPIALMGAERSPDLMQILRDEAPRYASTEDDAEERAVRFLARDMIDLFASDQDEFLAEDIPAVWFTSPGMSFYHQVTDDPETLDYRSMKAQARWLAHVIYALDRHEGRLAVTDPPPWDAFLLTEMDEFWQGVLESDFLEDDERAAVEAVREEIAPAVAAGDPSLIEDPDDMKLRYILLLFQITRNNPGPIPPPFPDDE